MDNALFMKIMAGMVALLIGIVAYFLRGEHGRQQEIASKFTVAMADFGGRIADLTLAIKELELKIIKEFVPRAEFEKVAARMEKDMNGMAERLRREMESLSGRKQGS